MSKNSTSIRLPQTSEVAEADLKRSREARVAAEAQLAELDRAAEALAKQRAALQAQIEASPA